MIVFKIGGQLEIQASPENLFLRQKLPLFKCSNPYGMNITVDFKGKKTRERKEEVVATQILGSIFYPARHWHHK